MTAELAHASQQHTIPAPKIGTSTPRTWGTQCRVLQAEYGCPTAGGQQRTIFGELMPLVALRVSITNCDWATMAL